MEGGAALPRSGGAIQAAAEGAPLERGYQRTTVVDKRPRHAEKEEALFGVKIRKPQKRTSTEDRTNKKAKNDEAKHEKDKIERKTQSLMTFSRLSVGLRMLGVVRNVTPDKVVVSLVNSLVASLPWSEVSDEHFAAFDAGGESPTPLPDLLPVGTTVRCIVTHAGSADGKDRFLKVSLRVSLLNKAGSLDQHFSQVGSIVVGSIKSVEDHGVLVNLGTKHITGFLPFGNVPGGKRALALIGKQVECEVQSRPSKSVANLKITDADAVCVQDSSSFLTLQPGMLLEVKVIRDDLMDGGSLFSFWAGLMSATTDWHHRGSDGLEEKSKVKARVVWLDPASKAVGVSLLDFIVRRVPIEWSRSIGEVVEDAVIDNLQPKFGVSMRLPEPAFAHLGRLVDSKELPDPGTVRKEFEIGKKVRCRILDINYLDGTYGVSLQPSILSAAVTSYEGLKPGDLVKGTVVKSDASFGVLVELGKNVKGIVTMMHLSDSSGQESAPESKFKLGQQVKGRVLTRENERVSLTLKKSLVMSTTSIVTSYEAATPGSVCQGFVTKVDDFGIIVTFFGGVHGLVPAFTLGPSASERLDQMYRVGQVVKVRIVSVDPQKSRMRLSFNTAGGDEPMSDPKSNKQTELSMEVGDTVSQAVVQSISDDQDIVVEFKAPDGQLAKGLVPQGHLSDYCATQTVAAHASRFVVGQKVKNLTIMRKRFGKFDCLLSMKPILVEASAFKEPVSIEDVDIERTYLGFVSNITDFGVFVQFGKGLIAYVPLANVSDAFVSKPNDFFELNQTVKVAITSVDLAAKRIMGSLKPSVVGSASAIYLKGLLEEQRRMFFNRTAEKSILNQIRPGAAVKGRVSHSVQGVGMGVTLEGSNLAQGFCTVEHTPDQKIARVGTEMDFRVLDVDLSNKGVIDLSGRKSLQNAKWRDETSAFVGMEFDAEVELGKREYCVVSYKTRKDGDARELALCSCVDFTNSKNPPQPLRPGSKCRVRISNSIPTMLELVATSHVDTSLKNRPRARSGSLSEFLGPKVDLEAGAVINAKIRDIKGCWMRFDVRQTGSKSTRIVMHSTDVIDHPSKYRLREDVKGVFAEQSVGDVVRARVSEIKGHFVYLSMRPSVVDASGSPKEVVDWDANTLKVGKTFQGWVDQVTEDGVYVGLSRKVRGFCYCAEVTSDLEFLEELFNGGTAQTLFPIGRPVKVKVLSMDIANKKMELKMMWDEE